VGIDEARDDRAASQIHQARPLVSEPSDVRTGTDFRDAVAGDRDRLGHAQGRIEGDDFPAEKDQIGMAHARQ
jgi:hypothetical protein